MKLFGFKLSITEAIIIFVIVAVIVYYLYSGASKKLAQIRKDKELNKLQESIEPVNLSFDEITYKNYADVLHSAMARNGTDEATIYQTFKKLITTDDLKALIVAFGERTQPRNPFALPVVPMTLAQFLHDELTADEIKTLNKILWDKGIKIQF